MTILELLPILLFHFVLTALPAAAATVYAAKRGVRSVPILLSIGLATTGLIAMASFWMYYAEPAAGKAFSVSIVVGSLAVLAVAIARREWWLDRATARQLAIPLGLWGCGAAFVLFLGFAHGGLSSPIATSITRFSHPLPTDSEIPYFFANWFYLHGHGGTPPVFPGEWLSSDRPPLQVGYVLAQRPRLWGNIELQ
ncbi:MAG TPA: hypothetical protein VE133_13130, partial [Candidatus Sulfotelmatobacter sp.]|nr:hypothetical protein [Candidatus Sulfotelmatobacter sp.]